MIMDQMQRTVPRHESRQRHLCSFGGDVKKGGWPRRRLIPGYFVMLGRINTSVSDADLQKMLTIDESWMNIIMANNDIQMLDSLLQASDAPVQTTYGEG